MIPPTCGECQGTSALTSGLEIYPHRPDLHDKPIWKCEGCGAYVGCHPGTTNPLGTPAGHALRQARMLLHNRMIDPLWKTADRCGFYSPKTERSRKAIRRRARERVYIFLSQQLGIGRDETHTGMFDIETCRRAWKALQGVTYQEIREATREHHEQPGGAA